MKRLLTIFTLCLVSATVVANPTDSLSIKPIDKLNSPIVIDTLPTADQNLAVVLFNDNTWRYVSTATIKADSTAFTNYWDQNNLFPYHDVALSSIPESVPIQLVDSLRAYRYPYKGHITSRYGIRRNSNHKGIDIALKIGDTICSPFDGKVRYANATTGGYGLLVIVRHDNGLETYHAHLSERLVEPGDRVVAGQPIALGGSSGRSSGPHLHFECRYMGQVFDPERIFNFKTGELRRDFILLKRNYFNIHSKYEQDFNAEVVQQEAVKKEQQASAARQYHKIKSGDCLSLIARRYHTTVSAICRLNGIKESDNIQIGKTIRVK